MKQGQSRVWTQYLITSGEFGVASSQTVIVALLPILLAQFTDSALWIGFAIGGEGIFALALPFWAGKLSDRMPSHLAKRYGRRAIFLFLMAPIMAVATAVAPFVSGYWALAGLGFAYFAAMHAYVTPFMALLVDHVPDDRRGRVLGVQGALRAAGLGYGLVASGLLFAVWKPAPFLAAAVLVLVTTALTTFADRAAAAAKAATERTDQDGAHLQQTRSAWHQVLHKPAAFRLLLANSLWNAAIDGIRPYIFLYAVAVFGTSVAGTSTGLLFLVVGLALGSVISGHLGDRFDRTRLLGVGAGLMAAAMLGGFFAQSVGIAVAVALVAGLGASVMITLPYPIFANIMGEHTAGEYTGLFVVGVGLGRIVAPMLVGAAIDLGSRWLPEQKGYPFMWLVAGSLATLGWLALRLEPKARDSK